MSWYIFIKMPFLLWVAIFSQAYPASYIWISFTVENSLLRSVANTERNHPQRYFSGLCTSSLINGNIPILVQIIYLVNDRCQGKILWKEWEQRETVPSFPLLLHCFVAFLKAESFSKMCFLWINCMCIYGFWWESKPLVALICIFIWVFFKKNRERLFVWIWNLLQAPQFLTRGCSVKYFIWKMNCSI